MKKIVFLIIICLIITVPKSEAQFHSDGIYLWNSSHVTYSVNSKFLLDFANKDQYSNTIGRLEYYHLDLTAYRKMTSDFSLGLGVRRTESYKASKWNPGSTFLLYGVYYLNPGNVKIKFANRVTAKVYKSAETLYGLDNITNVDFFTHSTRKFPKPYLMDEIFSNIEERKINTVRIYGGFRLLKTHYFGFDLFYCYWRNRSDIAWKEFNVWGMNTKFYI